MMVYRIPKCFPDLLKWNKSYTLLSRLFYNFWDFFNNIVLLSFEIIFFILARIEIVRFFDSEPPSLFRLFMPLIVLCWTMKKSWRSHSNFLKYWFRSKQRTDSFVINLYPLLDYLFSSVNLILVWLLQVNTRRERFIIWWLM
jgi:hypothetical protein